MKIFERLNPELKEKINNLSKDSYKLYNTITAAGYEFCFRKFKFIPKAMHVNFRYSSICLEFVSQDKRRKNNTVDITLMPTVNDSIRTGVATITKDAIDSCLGIDYSRIDTAEEIQHPLVIMLMAFKMDFDGSSYSFIANKLNYENSDIAVLKDTISDALALLAIRLKDAGDLDDFGFIHCHYNSAYNKLKIVANDKEI